MELYDPPVTVTARPMAAHTIRRAATPRICPLTSREKSHAATGELAPTGPKKWCPSSPIPTVQDRVAATTVDDHAVVLMAAGAGHAVGVQPADEPGIARLFIHQVGDRKVHGRLRAVLM